MSPEQLKSILEAHEKWINREGGERANLHGANLHGADLREANLREANLREANLRWADLHEANLRWADLREANLREADLHGANLREANLRWADLHGADLHEADLREANLHGTGCLHARFGGYDVWVSPTHTRVGCQFHANEAWLGLSFDSAEKMADGAREWWRLYRGCVFAMIESAQRQDWPVDRKAVAS